MFNLLISNAFAEGAAPAQQNPIMSMIPLVLVFMVFYFLMLRPQKKKMEEERKYVEALQKGEEVYTKSGIIGTIYGVTDKIVTLDVGDGQKLKVLKSYVGGSTKAIFETKQPAAAPAKK
jgi:preprotein translocase subunit YajC